MSESGVNANVSFQQMYWKETLFFMDRGTWIIAENQQFLGLSMADEMSQSRGEETHCLVVA